MKKSIAMFVAFTTIITTSNVVFAGTVNETKKVPFPYTVSSTVYKESPYWIFNKIEATTENATKWDSGFKLIMGHMYPTKECRSDNHYSWRESKPDCNKFDIDWSYIGNPKTGELSETKVILLDVDLGKSMSWDEQWSYIDKISTDKSAILGKAYIMTVNPKYYETKKLSEDKSVYLLPIKEGFEPKDITFAFSDGNNYKYYKDSNSQYFRSFGVGDNIIYWEKVFKNDEYEKKIESSFAKCSSDSDYLDCIEVVVTKLRDTAYWKILGYEVETNPDEETKALAKDLSGLFDE